MPAYFHYDATVDRMFSSNVDYFPSSGAPPDHGKPILGRYHLPQYHRVDDPARPFYHTDARLIRSSGLLRTLAHVPEDEISVHKRTDSNHAVEWRVVYAQHWISLQPFLAACCAALGGEDIPTREKDMVTQDPFWIGVDTKERAQRRALHGQQVLSWYLAFLSFRISLHIERARQGRRSLPWYEILKNSPNVKSLSIVGADGGNCPALMAIEELQHSFVGKFSSPDRSCRVGVFINTQEIRQNDRTKHYLQAGIPVWLDWGDQFSNRSHALRAMMPAACSELSQDLIPHANATDTARKVSAYSWTRSKEIGAPQAERQGPPARTRSPTRTCSPTPAPAPLPDVQQAKPFKFTRPNRVNNAMVYRLPTPGEYWLSYLNDRQRSIDEFLNKTTHPIKQATASRAELAAKWRYASGCRVITYTLDKAGCVKKAEVHNNSATWDEEEDDTYLPPDRRFIPALGWWEVCYAWYRDDQYKHTHKERTHAAYGRSTSDPYVEDPDAPIPASSSASAKWRLYIRTETPFIRPEDLRTVQPDSPLQLYTEPPPEEPMTEPSMEELSLLPPPKPALTASSSKQVPPAPPPADTSPVARATAPLERPIEELMEELPAHPPAGELPVLPSADKLPVSPPANELPMPPPADELPVSPPADEPPAPPPANELAVSPPADERSAHRPTDDPPVPPPADTEALALPASKPAFPLGAVVEESLQEPSVPCPTDTEVPTSQVAKPVAPSEHRVEERMQHCASQGDDMPVGSVPAPTASTVLQVALPAPQIAGLVPHSGSVAPSPVPPISSLHVAALAAPVVPPHGNASRGLLQQRAKPLARKTPDGGHNLAPRRAKKLARDATWARHAPTHGTAPPAKVEVVGHTFDADTPFCTTRFWQLPLARTAVQRWNYRAPAQDKGNADQVASLDYRGIKTPFAAVSFFGARIACQPNACLDEVLRLAHISEPEFRRLWNFAENLHAGGRQDQMMDPDSYFLAQPAYRLVMKSLDDCRYLFTPIHKPENMHEAYPFNNPQSLCWIIDEKPSCVRSFGVLCVTDPLAVMFALRSESTLLEELALEFAGQGVPFFMPKPLDQIPQVAAAAMDAYEVEQIDAGFERGADYTFVYADYESFRHVLLHYVQADRRFGRLALLSGGVPWRLALPFQDLHSILEGPSAYSRSLNPEMSLRFTYCGITLAEDRFLETEQMVAIGEVRVPSGSNEACPSFYPPYKAWFGSIHGHVGWNDAAEQWLIAADKRYRSVSEDDRTRRLVFQPNARSRWGSSLGKFYDHKSILKEMRDRACRLLTEYFA